MKNIIAIVCFVLVITGCRNNQNISSANDTRLNVGSNNDFQSIDAGMDAQRTLPVNVRLGTNNDEFNPQNTTYTCVFAGQRTSDIFIVIWSESNSSNVDIGFRRNTANFGGLHFNETNMYIDALKDNRRFPMPRFSYRNYDADHISRQETVYWRNVNQRTLSNIRPVNLISFRVIGRDIFTITRSDYDVCMRYLCENNNKIRCPQEQDAGISH